MLDLYISYSVQIYIYIIMEMEIFAYIHICSCIFLRRENGFYLRYGTHWPCTTEILKSTVVLRKWAVPIDNKCQLEISDFAFFYCFQARWRGNFPVLYAKIGLIKDINQLHSVEGVLWKTCYSTLSCGF